MRTPIKSLLLVLCASACSCDGNSPLRLPDLAGAPVELEPAPSRKTTSERVAVSNLDASIDATQRRLQTRIEIPTASTLIEQLMLRVDFYGTFDDWDEAIEVSRAVHEAFPANPEAILLRARVLNTLHEFDAALALVEEARSQYAGRMDSELEAFAIHVESTVRLAQGGLNDELVARRQVLAKSVPTYQNVTGLALALAKQGRFEDADEAFRRALERYRDVSPFPFAWVAFQRGVMWSEQAGRPDLGRLLYEEALRYLPGYVLANVHLAELDADAGNVRDAIARVEPLVRVTENPEPLVLLAALEPSPALARLYATQADQSYRALLARFPEAFSHHFPGTSRP